MNTQEPTPARQQGALDAYLAAIRAHPVIIAVITLATVAASIAFLATRSSQYEATTDVLVTPVPPEDQVFFGLPVIRDSGDPVRTAQTASSLIESQDAAVLAAKRLGDGWTPKELLEAVEVAPRGESDVLAVSAITEDPDEAAEVANVFSESALDVRAGALTEEAAAEVEELDARLKALPPTDPARAEVASRRDQLDTVAREGDPTLSLSQEAIPPTSAVGAPPVVIAVLAVIAGFILASGTALLMELFARRVRDSKDAFSIFPLPVLARVPEVPSRRLHGSDEDSGWYMPPEIREPFRTLALQVDQRRGSRGAVMVTSASSGDGKTTSAVNLAVSLAAGGREVILLDLDLRNPQVGNMFGIEVKHTIGDLLDPDARLQQLLIRPTGLESLRVMAVQPTSGEAGLIDAVGNVLPQLISEARLLADHVVIDTAPLGEVGDALRFVQEVDDVLVVMRPGNTHRQHLQILRDLLERIGQEPAGCVLLTRLDGSSRGYYAYGHPGVATGSEAGADRDRAFPRSVEEPKSAEAPDGKEQEKSLG